MANISSFPEKPARGVLGVQGFFKGKAWAQLDEPNEETDHSAASLNSGAKMSFRWSASRMFNLSPRLTLRYSDFEFCCANVIISALGNVNISAFLG
jgi:hypothetical protein